MGRVLRTERAGRDLVDIWIYVAADSPAAADRLLETIDQSCQRLSQFPEMGRRRLELGPSVRSLPAGNYVVFFRPAPAGIEVLRVLHGARDIQDLR